MKNNPRYYVTSAMLNSRGACIGSQRNFNQLFRVGPHDHVELTNPVVVKKLLENSEFRHRLDWPVRRLYAALPAGTKLDKATGKIADQLSDIGYRYEHATSDARRQALVEKATKLLSKTGQLWDRYKLGER